MTIKVYPEDLVKLGVWDSYVYYVVGSDLEAEKQLKENKEFEHLHQDEECYIFGNGDSIKYFNFFRASSLIILVEDNNGIMQIILFFMSTSAIKIILRLN